MCHADDGCPCASGRAFLERYARDLTTRGLTAASQGDFTSAEALLAGAVAVDPTLSRSWEALGLCLFSRGEVRGARSAWRTALAGDSSSAAEEWLRQLANGELAVLIGHYNEALALVNAGEREEALRRLELAATIGPEFLPVIRAEGLLRERLGKGMDGESSWPQRARLWSSDPVIHQLLAMDATHAPRRAAVALPARSAAPDRRWPIVLAAVLLLLLAGSWALFAPDGGERRDASSERPHAATSAVSPEASPPRGLASGARIDHAQGRRAYLAGRSALRKGADSLAIRALSRAADAPSDAYYMDDALYLLMLTQERSGDHSAARSTARRLLESHATSIYANSRTRRLARAGQPTTAP